MSVLSNAVRATARMTFDEFLAFEAEAKDRHEFVAGVVYAMGGGTDWHNIVSGNLFAALHHHLAEGPCRAFMADMGLRARSKEEDDLFYPDVMVCCDPADSERLYRERPTFLAEVASRSTERIDRGEKFTAYRAIPSVREYAIVQCDTPRIELFRRADDWRPTVFWIEDDARFDSVGLTIPMRRLYQGVSYLQ